MTDRLTIAPAPLSAMTPELLAAMREWMTWWCGEAPVNCMSRPLYLAIERAGILAPPAPPRAPVPDALWAGADALAEDEA